MEELIGGVPVNSASLDGIGSIGFAYGSGVGGGFSGASSAGGGNAPATGGAFGGAPPSAGAGGSGPSPSSFYAQCTGTLISKSSVLTSRSCGQLLEQSYYSGTLKFAIGPDSTQPKRLVDVVDVEFAPADTSGGGFTYPDIAVLHLGESVTDVTPFPVALLTDDLIGKQLASVGLGNNDLRYRFGTRRAGALTLRATSGLLYPAIFGSFDAFYQYEISGGYPYYPPYGGVGGTSALPVAIDAPLPAGGAIGVGGSGPTAGAGGSPPGGGAAGFGAAGSGGAAGGGGDWYREYLQQLYDNTALATGEAYLGGTDADAQPCGADVGGPIVRKLQNKVRVFGVFSRTPFRGCDKGGIYASITAATKAFIDAAAQWKDPCTGITANGACVGTTATRCSTVFEGKRRAVKLDCSLLNQVCVGGGTTEVACTDN